MDPAINFSIGFDACAIVICVVIMANYYSVRRIHTRTEKLFQVLMGSLLFSAAANLVFVMLSYAPQAPEWLSYMVVMIMVIAVHSVGIIFMLYVVSECYENRPLPGIFTGIALLFIAFTGVSVALYSLRRYMGGGAESAITASMYVAHYLALATAAVYVIINRSVLDIRKKVNIVLFIAFNVAATVVRAFTNAQVTAFAQSVAVMLIFATLRNPNDEIDRQTNTFNAQAFKDFIRLQISSGRPFLLFVWGIKNVGALNALWGQNTEGIVKEAADRIGRLTEKNTYIYRTGEARFAMVFNTRERYERFREKYAAFVKSNFYVGEVAVPVDHIAVLISFPDIASKYADIENILKFYRERYTGNGEITEAAREAVESVERREKVDYAVRKAIGLHSFSVYYQPIYDLRRRSFGCCEALVRLYDDELGFIPPDEFIPISEANGTIIDVGREVIAEVCKFVKQYRPDLLGVEFIDVNLSIIQCLQPDISADVDGILRQYGVPRGMINLEITETASSKSYAALLRQLNQLHSDGFTLSLDDFGTGFSSVEFLINFPFDIVKLDRSLVRAYMQERKYKPILQHYMPMLHSLGTKIVAEGVETSDMVDALDALGCDYLQGYYYAKPLTGEEFIGFLQKNNGPRCL